MLKDKVVEITEEELQQKAQELNKKKVEAFAKEYNSLVEKHKLHLVGVASITPEGVQTSVDVRPVQGK